MSTPFRFILGVRERLFAAGVLRTRRLHHPVISIGNLTLGGTGKTPLTIFLAQKMSERGLRPVILSRGYRRKTRGTLIVSRGQGPVVDWQQAGDEPFLMARRLTGVAAVVVGESRHQAGLLAEREDLGDLLILDDGFQHRQLHRDFDIVAIDPNEWNAGESLLPTGRWREPKAALTRAHAACVQGEGSLDLPIPQFSFRLEPRIEDIEALKGKPVSAFAGIAKPERFFSLLESLGLNVQKRVSFPDHHSYSDRDFDALKGDILITTEKDAVKLEGRGGFFVLRVSANIAGFERLEALILQRLGSR